MEVEILCNAYGFLCERLRGGAKVDADKMSRFRDKSENREVQVALVHCLQLGNGIKDVELFCDEVFDEIPLGLRSHLVQHLLGQWHAASARREQVEIESKMQGLGDEESSELVSMFPLSEWKGGRMTPSRCLEVINANMQCGSLGRALGERMEQHVLSEGGYAESGASEAESESQALQRIQWRSYNFSPRRGQHAEGGGSTLASLSAADGADAGGGCDGGPGRSTPSAPAAAGKHDLVELEQMQLSFADLVPRPQLVYLTAEGHCTVALDDTGTPFARSSRPCLQRPVTSGLDHWFQSGVGRGACDPAPHCVWQGDCLVVGSSIQEALPAPGPLAAGPAPAALAAPAHSSASSSASSSAASLTSPTDPTPTTPLADGESRLPGMTIAPPACSLPPTPGLPGLLEVYQVVSCDVLSGTGACCVLVEGRWAHGASDLSTLPRESLCWGDSDQDREDHDHYREGFGDDVDPDESTAGDSDPETGPPPRLQTVKRRFYCVFGTSVRGLLNVAAIVSLQGSRFDDDDQEHLPLPGLLIDQQPTSVLLLGAGVAVVRGTNCLLAVVTEAGPAGAVRGVQQGRGSFIPLTVDRRSPRPESAPRHHDNCATITAASYAGDTLYSADNHGVLCAWTLPLSGLPSLAGKCIDSMHPQSPRAQDPVPALAEPRPLPVPTPASLCIDARIEYLQASPSGRHCAVATVSSLLVAGMHSTRLPFSAQPQQHVYIRAELDGLPGTACRYAVKFFGRSIHIMRATNNPDEDDDLALQDRGDGSDVGEEHRAAVRAVDSLVQAGEIRGVVTASGQGFRTTRHGEGDATDAGSTATATATAEMHLYTTDTADMHTYTSDSAASIDLGPETFDGYRSCNQVATDSAASVDLDLTPSADTFAITLSETGAAGWSDSSTRGQGGLSVAVWVHTNIDDYCHRFSSQPGTNKRGRWEEDASALTDSEERDDADRRSKHTDVIPPAVAASAPLMHSSYTPGHSQPPPPPQQEFFDSLEPRRHSGRILQDHAHMRRAQSLFKCHTSESFARCAPLLAVWASTSMYNPPLSLLEAALNQPDCGLPVGDHEGLLLQWPLRDLFEVIFVHPTDDVLYSHDSLGDLERVVVARPEAHDLLQWMTRTEHDRVGQPFWIDASLGHNLLCTLYLKNCGNKSVAVEHEAQEYLKRQGPSHLRRSSRQLRLYTGGIRKIDETAGLRGNMGLPRQIGYISGLQEIYARRVGLQGRLPHELGELEHLRVLSMGNNYLCGELPASLTRLRNLQRIVLHQNCLTGHVPRGFARLGCIVNLAGNPHLEFGDDVPEVERAALVDMYTQSSGPGWQHKTNWTSSKPVSAWYKVGVLDSHVHSIVMSNNNMKGVLAASIGRLRHLRMIELASMSHLSGPLPRALCDLRHLKRLCICRCGISGPIPDQIGQLTFLEELQLFGNRHTGIIPDSIGNLTSLKLLSLGEYTGGNPFQPGPVPACIGRLRRLEALFLSNCNLTGPLPEWLGDLVELRQLDLQRNDLVGALPAATGRLSNLLYLNIKDNPSLGERAPLPVALLAGLTKLNRLSFVNCRFALSEPLLTQLQMRLPKCKIWATLHN